MRLEHRQPWRFVLLLPALAFLPGCGARDARAQGHADLTTELVLTRKPDSVDGFAKSVRNLYDLCVASAQVQNLPVKPFPALPATLGTARITYLIHGHDVVKHVEPMDMIDPTRVIPSAGCDVLVRAEKRIDVDIVAGNTHTSITTTAEGQPVVETEDISASRRAEASSPAFSSKGFTEARTVNGIEVHCLPKTSRALNPNGLQDLCVAAAEGVLTEADGQPIRLVSRVKPMGADSRFPFVWITEPTSLRTLEHPSPALFTAAAYTK